MAQQGTPDDGAAPPTPGKRPRLDAETLYALLVVVLLGGLAAAGYAAYEVLNPAASAICSVNSKVSCGTVAASGHTTILGVPDWAIGIGGFLVMLAVALLAYRTFDRSYLKVLALLSGLGLLVVVYLVYTETVVIGAICPVCTTAHALDVVAFGLTLALLKMSRSGPEDEAVRSPP